MDETLEPTHTPYEEVSSLEDSLPKLDVLYMTRVQKERFFNEEDYIRLKDTYILNREKLQLAKEDMPVLHPLHVLMRLLTMWMMTAERLIFSRYRTENICEWH